MQGKTRQCKVMQGKAMQGKTTLPHTRVVRVTLGSCLLQGGPECAKETTNRASRAGREVKPSPGSLFWKFAGFAGFGTWFEASKCFEAQGLGRYRNMSKYMLTLTKI